MLADPLPEIKRNTQARMRDFIRAVHVGETVQKAQNEGVNAQGDVLAPIELASEIITHRDLQGTFRANAQVYKMGTADIASIARRTGALSASWTAEGAAIAESSG